MGRFDGRSVIVTGGGQGIGAEICRGFARDGGTVAVFDRDDATAAAIADEVEGVSFDVDVRDGTAMTDAVRAAADAMGGLTDLVNNAGIGMTKPLLSYTDKEWHLLIDVNLTGTFNGIRAAAPIMLDAGGGSIVNNASLTGLQPTIGEGPYSAAKGGVLTLTRAAAQELAPAIRVNAVAPGMIRTPLTEMVVDNDGWRTAAESGTPMKRIGSAVEVSEVILFLLSDAASYVTGQTVVIDGGSSLPQLQTDSLLRALSGA